VELVAAGTRGAGTAATAAEFKAGVDLEAHIGKVYRDGLGLGQQFFVDEKRKIANFERIIGIFWLIQSQCQAGA